MRRHIDAEGAARQDGHPLLDQICGQIGRNAVAVRRCRPGAHDRYRPLHEVSKMSRSAEPQTDRLATAPLDALRMPQIIKPGRPLLIAWNDETRSRYLGQPLKHLDR